MRNMLDECQGHMGWDNEYAIEILFDYIEEIHWGWGKHDPDSHFKSYLEYAISEELNPTTKTTTKTTTTYGPHQPWYLNGARHRDGDPAILLTD